jgi:hypothetical protein
LVLRGGRGRLKNKGLLNLYASPDIIRVIKSWRMIWMGYVKWMANVINAYNILFGKLERK